MPSYLSRTRIRIRTRIFISTQTHLYYLSVFIINTSHYSHISYQRNATRALSFPHAMTAQVILRRQ